MRNVLVAFLLVVPTILSASARQTNNKAAGNHGKADSNVGNSDVSQADSGTSSKSPDAGYESTINLAESVADSISVPVGSKITIHIINQAPGGVNRKAYDLHFEQYTVEPVPLAVSPFPSSPPSPPPAQESESVEKKKADAEEKAKTAENADKHVQSAKIAIKRATSVKNEAAEKKLLTDRNFSLFTTQLDEIKAPASKNKAKKAESADTKKQVIEKLNKAKTEAVQADEGLKKADEGLKKADEELRSAEAAKAQADEAAERAKAEADAAEKAQVLANETDETKIPAETADLSEALSKLDKNDLDYKIGTAVIDSTKRDITLDAFVLAADQGLIVTIHRGPIAGNDSPTTWRRDFHVGGPGKFVSNYVFGFAPKYDDQYFSRPTGTTGQFMITKEGRRDKVAYVPLVLFSWIPASKGNDTYVNGFAGGLGYDLSNLVVAGSYLWTWHRNLGVTLGILGQQQRRLKGKYHQNDLVTTNLESADLTEPVWRPNLFVGISIRSVSALFH